MEAACAWLCIMYLPRELRRSLRGELLCPSDDHNEASMVAQQKNTQMLIALAPLCFFPA
jgi:hypothetical protein